MSKTRTAEVLFTPDSEDLRFLPEGPTRLRNGLLAWVAIQHAADLTQGSVCLLDLASGVNRRIDVPGRPGFLAETDQEGWLVLGLERSLAYLNIETAQVIQTELSILPNEHTVINDGIAIPGGLIFGSKDVRFSDTIAHIYFYRQATHEVIPIQGGQTCSNGKIFQTSEDGSAVLYDIDTPTLKVRKYRFDPESATLSEPETILDFEGDGHFPDGMRGTPDGKSTVVAFYNPHDVTQGSARQYNLTTGKLEAEWVFPQSPRVTCPEFVEMDGSVKLICTTADEGMSTELRAKNPNAGALFIADTDFTQAPLARPLVCFTLPI